MDYARRGLNYAINRIARPMRRFYCFEIGSRHADEAPQPTRPIDPDETQTGERTQPLPDHPDAKEKEDSPESSRDRPADVQDLAASSNRQASPQSLSCQRGESKKGANIERTSREEKQELNHSYSSVYTG